MATAIQKITLNVKASIKPCDRDTDKAPDYRVTANGVEFGADSDEVAQGFRFDGAHHSEMMSPSRWSLAGG